MLVQAVMSLYEGSRTKVRVGSGTSDEFGVRVGVHQVKSLCYHHRFLLLWLMLRQNMQEKGY